MATEEELINIIQKLVEEKTFSLEGAKAIAELKKSAEANRERLTEHENRINMHVREKEDYRTQINILNTSIEGYKAKEKSVVDREKECYNNEKRVAVSEAKASVIYDVFSMIFKNTIVRESVQKSVVAELPVQYPGQTPVTQVRQGDSEVKTTQKE